MTLRRRSRAHGYALILVMVAMVVLTILGLTGVTVSQLDVKIVQNLRQYRQVTYGALAGTDHARDLFRDGIADELSTYEAASATTGNCLNDWISTGPDATAAPIDLMANTTTLASYVVDVCAATCGPATAGNELGRGVVGYTLDIVADGSQPITTESSSSVGSFIYLQTAGASSCNGVRF